jgi:protein N-terminal methyltransferase
MLTPHGMIVIKENATESSTVVIDEVDSSVTRPLSHLKKLLKQANLRIVKENKQQNFPKDLFPVYILALKRAK